MAQFPQSFRINESLLQRNANFQALDCFLKQDRVRKKNNISFSHFRNRLNMPCSSITQLHRMCCLHNGSLIGFGVSEQRVSMWKICTIWHLYPAAVQWSYVTSCWLVFNIIAVLCGTSSLIKKEQEGQIFCRQKQKPNGMKDIFYTCYGNCYQ